MPRTAKATKPPNRPAPPTKDQIRAIADEAARIAEHIEAGGLSSHSQASIASLRRGPLLACIGAVANQGPELRELPPARRIDRYGRDVQVPEPRVRVHARPLSREQVAAGEGELLAYLNQILLFCGRASGKTAPETEIVSGLRAAAAGLRRWAGPDGKGIGSKPLPKGAALIYKMLSELPTDRDGVPIEAKMLPDIQSWYEKETGKNLDEGTWSKRWRPELEAHGMCNRPGVGYYILPAKK